MTRTKSLSEIEGAFVEASRMLDQRKLRPAVALLEFAAKSGLPAAQVMLGYCYDNGSGTIRSRKKALFWYRKAASAGDPAAAANIGAIFLKEGKKAAAMRWLLKAVQLGLPEALLDIAQLQGGPLAATPAAQASLRQLLRHKQLIPAVRETAQLLLANAVGGRHSKPSARL
ncbi:MAG: hypothetical protein MUC96_05665 [Myxococcaceae bacterium]|jgi:TPR repeat protein|nr:hypothetical protein [Myxococcaceae bacterium]